MPAGMRTGLSVDKNPETPSKDPERTFEFVFFWSFLASLSMPSESSFFNPTFAARPVRTEAPAVKINAGILYLGVKILTRLFAFLPINPTPKAAIVASVSIVISERISRDDVFTSVKIVEKEFKVRDTQLGPESLTRDIPNVSEEALKNLDESGIIYVGARVKQGDILVGRVSPKSETLLTPEEALLRNIFGEKALNVKDTSLRVGPNEEGTVIGVNVLTRHGVKKDERTQMIELQKIEKINRDREEETSIMERGFADQIFQLAEGQVIDAGTGSLKPFVGKKLTQEVFEGIKPTDVKKLVVRNKEIQTKIDELREQHVAKLKALNDKADAEVAKATETNYAKPD